MTTATGYRVRWGVRRDVPALAEFGAWGADEILDTLRRRECISMVAECGDDVLGYMVYELRRHALGLLTLAVRPDARRAGVGAALVAKLKYKLLSHQRERVVAAVPEANLPALLFLRAGGFKATGVDRDAAAVLMTWTPTAAEMEAFAVRWA